MTTLLPRSFSSASFHKSVRFGGVESIDLNLRREVAIAIMLNVFFVIVALLFLALFRVGDRVVLLMFFCEEEEEGRRNEEGDKKPDFMSVSFDSFVRLY